MARNRLLKIRVNQEEYEEAKEKAHASGYDFSTWARICMGLGHEKGMKIKEFLGHEEKIKKRILKSIQRFLERE
jgi:hypothetical protein